MSNERYGQGQGGRDQLLRDMVLSAPAENEEHYPTTSLNITRAPAQAEQRYLSQNDAQFSYQDVTQNREGRVPQQVYVDQSHPLLRQEVKMGFHQAASNISQGQGASPGPQPGLDGQSLYCTEVLPVASPPSQPITVEGGGTSRRGLLAVNGGAGTQPVQYTIIITDPQLQHNSSGSNNNSNSSGATNILLNTLVQQQQQQQLQQHIASISKANSNLNNLISGVQPSNANLSVNSTNSNNVNGSNKLNNVLLKNNNNNNNNTNNNNNNSNLNTGSGSINLTTTFPANLISNSLNNNIDGKSLQLTNVTLSNNAHLSSAVLDTASVEGGFVILSCTDPQLRAGAATITNINQLVSLHGKFPSTVDLVTQNSAHLVRVSGDSSISVGAAGGDSKRNTVADQQTSVGDSADPTQVGLRARVPTRDSVSYNGPVLDKDNSGSLDSSKDPTSHINHVLQAGEQLSDTSSSDRVSGGMHSGRTGAGSGQAHSTHTQQQQRHSPSTSTSSSAASADTPNQSVMLSAGQPAVPSGIFRTGTDNSSPSHRISGSGSSSYVPTQYPTIYGLHSQSAGHIGGSMQPYSFFPAFGGSGASGHGFSHGSLMAGTSPSHFPHVESYSAMLASMGSHVQRGAQGADRTPRVPAPGVSVPQRPSTFMPSGAHMAAPGSQYPSLPSSSSHRRLSGSSSPSPGPAAATHNPPPAAVRLDPVSSHHLEKLAAIKGGTNLQSREGDASRDLRLYGDSSSVHEEKQNLSPSSSYSASGHVPKVSFDSVVKEYGGGRDSPTGRGDSYFRASLSGKEGSLKHRILTRPSDSEMGDDLSKVSGVHGLKDEPVSKRAKFASASSASSTYGGPVSPGYYGENQRSGSRHHSVAHPPSHHSIPNNNSNTMENRGGGASHHSDNNLSGRQEQQPSSHYQHEENNTGNNKYKQAYHGSPSTTPPTSSPSSENPPSHLQYPSHFMKGSIIQLANGTLKRVEDLQTDDFVNSAEISTDLKVDSSTVVRIEEQPDRGTAMLSFSVGEHRVQVTVEATLEHPFFVFGQGWSSCSVSRTLARYGLDCQKLNVGDVCISLTHKDVNLKAAEISQQQQQQQQQQQEQSYMLDNKLSVSSGAVTSEHQIPSSSSALPSPSSSSSSSISSTNSSSTFSSTLKPDNSDGNFLPPPSSSAAVGKRRLSQAELPPPSSNIVPVKKENNNSHNSQRRGAGRIEGEVKQEEEFGEDDDSDSTSSLRKRRWSAPDPVSVKADQERERERQMLANEAQKAEEAAAQNKTATNDNGRP